ncbi:MAG: efflux RND transporter periplasmic adaptor subunit [Saccharospirillaceae bacterium]|nr:efflux RND transporter periplasmic adaptor subunit [Saccharospirillaceae bacterium]
MFLNQRHSGSVAVAIIAMWGLTGCDPAVPDEEVPAPIQVSVMTLEPVALQITEDLPGRITALRNAEIRAQVSGLVERQLFREGTAINTGTVLFQINPAIFQSEVDMASAALTRAEVAQQRASHEAERLASLMPAGAVSRQMYDDAVAQRDQALAEVAQAKASLARHRLNLQFTRVEAPISGRIDQALVSEGALVSPTDAMPMARIQQIDQVYADVRLPASMLADIHQQMSSDTAPPAVEILTGDGKPLGMRGHMLFSGTEVNTGSGDVLLRVLVDNPQQRLLPGLFVRVRIPRAHYPAALSVPQEAVTRVAGQPRVWVVDAQGQSASNH